MSVMRRRAATFLTHQLLIENAISNGLVLYLCRSRVLIKMTLIPHKMGLSAKS